MADQSDQHEHDDDQQEPTTTAWHLRHRRTHSTPIRWSEQIVPGIPATTSFESLQIPGQTSSSSLLHASPPGSPPRTFSLSVDPSLASSPRISPSSIPATITLSSNLVDNQLFSASPSLPIPPPSSLLSHPPSSLPLLISSSSSPISSSSSSSSSSPPSPSPLSSSPIVTASASSSHSLLLPSSPASLLAHPSSSSPALLAPSPPTSPPSSHHMASAPTATMATSILLQSSSSQPTTTQSSLPQPPSLSLTGTPHDASRPEEYHGASIEVYGFVAWICSFAGGFAYLIWAFVPDELLHQWGITYYPAKYWAIAIPTWFTVTFFACILLYVFLSQYLCVADLDSIEAITDRHARQDVSSSSGRFLNDAIPQVFDMPLQLVNDHLYN